MELNTSPETEIRVAGYLMESVLARVTGLDSFCSKLVVYYTLATHALNYLNTFPLLVLKGPMGTGKSTCERVVERFAFQPRLFNLRGRTVPVIRDELAKCHDGTAIIEEADQAWKDAAFESMLSDRYQRETATAGLKESDGAGGYDTKELLCFGATVLHKRLPFKDAALEGRSVFVPFRARHGQQYTRLDDSDIAKDLADGEHVIKGIEFPLPEVEPLPGVAARVMDSYRPVVAMAQICADSHFLDKLKDYLQLQTHQFKEAQSQEPDGMVLRALIGRITRTSSKFDFSRNVKLSDIANTVWENEREQVTPRHVGAFLRDLGFETKCSHGLTVVVPRPEILVKACIECGYEDELIAALRTELLSGREGRVGRPIPARRTDCATQIPASKGAAGRAVPGPGAQLKATPHAGEGLPTLPALPKRESRSHGASRKKEQRNLARANRRK